MTDTPSAGLTNYIASAIRASLTGTQALGAVVCITLIVIAGVIAPGDAPGTWAWVRLLLAASAAGVALALAFTARQSAVAVNQRLASTLLIGLFLLVAIVLSATFNILTALFAVVILTLVLLHLGARGPASELVFWALLGTLVPLWVWSAFDVWDRWLLMLIPLGAAGIVSLEHALRADLSHGVAAERYASWIGVVLMAAVLLLTSLLIDAQVRWVTIGAVITAVLAGIDLLPVRRSFGDALPGFTLPGLALLVLAFAWLLAL